MLLFQTLQASRSLLQLLVQEFHNGLLLCLPWQPAWLATKKGNGSYI